MKFKGYLIFGIVMFFSKFGLSQKFNQHALQFSIGNHAFLTETQSEIKYELPAHLQFGYKYSINRNIGFLFDVAYDELIWRNSSSNSHYLRLNIQPCINIGELMGLNQFRDKVGLYLHCGVGVSQNSNKNAIVVRNDEFHTAHLKDRMGNFSLGLSPIVLLNERFSLFFDVCYLSHVRQQRYFDMLSKRNENKSLGGKLFNFSIGLNYYFGEEKTHIDWQEENHQTINDSKIEVLESEINSLKKKLEKENGNKISRPSQGIEELKSEKLFLDSLNNPNKLNMRKVDSDGDGVIDEYDFCPFQYGLLKGCPDTDKDGVPDVIDQCPFEKGDSLGKGCPSVSIQKPKEIENIVALYSSETENTDKINQLVNQPINIYFSTGSFSLNIDHMDKLNEIANSMKNNSELYLELIGYADNSGNSLGNQKLAKKRADETLIYLVHQGVPSERIISSFSVVPVNEQNPSINRRVSLKFKKY
ncbi:MAG: hypothetical protein RL264_3154 [Bacteroidota bacterium]|jgi:OOP family OmpA-OmpF porin